jgi:hypothetical protein
MAAAKVGPKEARAGQKPNGGRLPAAAKPERKISGQMYLLLEDERSKGLCPHNPNLQIYLNSTNKSLIIRSIRMRFVD